MQTSFANLRWLHMRLRLAGFRMRGLRKANAPACLGKDAQAFEIGAPEDWGRYLKRLDQRLMEFAARRAPSTQTVGPVIVLGLRELDVGVVASLKDVTLLAEDGHQPMNAPLVGISERDPDFVERWCDAMLAAMGADEAQKFALTLGEAHHDQRTL